MIQFQKSKKTLYYSKDYHLFNLLIFISIIILYLYLKTELIIIKCPYSEIDIKCNTCGLTTDFKRIINGNFITIDLGHFLLFILFISQLLIRPTISFLLYISNKNKLIKNIDISTTILLIILTYIELNK
jgi:hypothetical protein